MTGNLGYASYFRKLSSLDISGVLLSSSSFDHLLSSVDVFRSECFTSLRARKCGLDENLATGFLKGMLHLKCLDLSENLLGPRWVSMFSNCISILSSLSNLMLVEVTSTSLDRILSDFSPELPHAVTCNLVHLDISRNHFDFRSFNKLMHASTDLVSLFASDCNLDDSDLQTIFCTNLQCLDVSFNELSQRAVSAFFHSMPGLKELNVGHCFHESELDIPLILSPHIDRLWLDNAVF
jgi:hypothetical protein